MKMPQLNSMSVSDLIDLEDELESLISKKVATERALLEAQLAKLGGYDGAKRGRPPGKRGTLKGSKVAAKYRNPDDRSQQWAGRGMQPAWVRDALKAGKTLEDLLIAGMKSVVKKVHGKRGRPSKNST